MRLLRVAALLALLAPWPAQADLFEFSYQFSGGQVLHGQFDGTANGSFVEGLSNISVFVDGTPFNGNPNLVAWGYTGSGWDVAALRVAFDASLNNFMFLDHFSSFTNWFHLVGSVSSGAAFAGPTGVFANNELIDPSRWLLTAVMTPIPEPEAYAMLLTGLALLGFATRKRRMTAAA